MAAHKRLALLIPWRKAAIAVAFATTIISITAVVDGADMFLLHNCHKPLKDVGTDILYCSTLVLQVSMNITYSSDALLRNSQRR